MLNPAEHENSNPYLINPMQFAGSLVSPVLAVHIILYAVMYKTIFVINIIIHMCLQHSNTL